MAKVRAHVRDLRQRAGLQQQELAARIGVSRQSMCAIEAGTVPSTMVALELARALACRVEDLFILAEAEQPVEATLAPSLSAAPPLAVGSRVRLGFVSGSWIAHRLEGDDPSALATPADGLVARVRRGAQARVVVRPLLDLDALRTNLLVAGCDPALGLLAGHLARGTGHLRMHWLAAASDAALEAFARGLVHVAGLHLFDAATGEHNLPAVRARLGERPFVLVSLAAWEQGFVARKNRRVRRAADLEGPGVRVVLREPGSGARALLERQLVATGLPLARLTVAETVHGHHSVAQSVARGHADVGVATAAAAAAFGLDFVPLAEDRFDLVLPADAVTGSSGLKLLETMASARFRRDIGALPGYDTAATGKVVAHSAA